MAFRSIKASRLDELSVEKLEAFFRTGRGVPMPDAADDSLAQTYTYALRVRKPGWRMFGHAVIDHVGDLQCLDLRILKGNFSLTAGTQWGAIEVGMARSVRFAVNRAVRIQKVHRHVYVDVCILLAEKIGSSRNRKVWLTLTIKSAERRLGKAGLLGLADDTLSLPGIQLLLRDI